MTTTPADSDTRTAHLRTVFEMVQNTANWKGRIDATIPQHAATKADIHEAVIHFTGSVPRIESTTALMRYKDGLVAFEVPSWHVRGAGYYATIGA